jgi:predicted amidohydrolase
VSVVTVGAAQLGPIARGEGRGEVVKRLVALLHEAKGRGCDLVVFPELALTTFFPRWAMTDQVQIDAFFEREIPGPETQPLFDEAYRLGLAFCLGYAELAEEAGVTRRYNTAILVDRDGHLVGKYRKIHLPGHAEFEPWRPFQHLEKRYFDVGDLGFGVWRVLGGLVGMCICNDRRWPETYRVMGLQGVEMVLLGYNTPVHIPARARARPARQLPQPARHAGRRLPERHLGGRRGQVRARGGRGPDRPEPDHRALRRDDGHGDDARRRADRRPLRPRSVPLVQDDGLRLRPASPARALPAHHRANGRRPARVARAGGRRGGGGDRRDELPDPVARLCVTLGTIESVEAITGRGS